ncbi:hypothetical protein CD178_03358 (plasmid) [Komagataeibacter saccharivorans]|uniref:Uncharacterized protein n=1 Tax=Komagataeibacter saccharivorans TaxID=265959 RepID=A0A347WGV9_9PROT|nr:hypothetical protein CD178_03358 [Komagataeibacter saccharivorans]
MRKQQDTLIRGGNKRFLAICLNLEPWTKRRLRLSCLNAAFSTPVGRAAGKSFISRECTYIRQTLYMPALVAIRFTPDLRRIYACRSPASGMA